MAGESDENVFLIQIDASGFAEFEISEFELSKVDCIYSINVFEVARTRVIRARVVEVSLYYLLNRIEVYPLGRVRTAVFYTGWTIQVHLTFWTGSRYILLAEYGQLFSILAGQSRQRLAAPSGCKN